MEVHTNMFPNFVRNTWLHVRNYKEVQ